jgi:hypothetical protein
MGDFQNGAMLLRFDTNGPVRIKPGPVQRISFGQAGRALESFIVVTGLRRRS